MVLTCRLCLTGHSEDKLKNIFQCNINHSEDSLIDILFWVFSVEIDVTDPFSKDICSDCVQLIEYILQVKNTFRKNQESLKTYLPGQNSTCLAEAQILDDGGIEKVCNNGQTPSSSSTTPTNSPSKSGYKSKNVYGSCSPRVRVSLSNMEAMCSMHINLVQFEKTQEYLRYRRLKNGRFKKRKYRHFDMDETLLDDICNTLDDKKCAKTEPSKRDIGVATELSLVSKAVNTDEKSICTCNKNITKPLKFPPVDSKKEIEAPSDDNLLEIIGLTKNAIYTISSSEVDKEYDWTTLTFKKDTGTNTESNILTTRSIGTNAKVRTATTGTLTKRFKRMKKKNVVQVNIESLECFGPTVVLEPLENILEEENYKKISDFSYIKKEVSSSESEPEEDLQQGILKEDQQDIKMSKKQKFLDYYKNFSSFAVRELIAGKKIRESYSETSPIFKISNVCEVLVCDYCSKSFLSQISLNLHYRRAHRTVNKPSDAMEMNDSVNNRTEPLSKQRILSKKIWKRPGMSAIKSTCNIKNETGKEGGFKNGDANFSTQRIETPARTKSMSKNNCNDNNMERKVSGSRRKVQKVNYNVKDIIQVKTKVKEISPNAKRKNKITKLEKLVVDNEHKRDISYVWDRQSLGKYSAISYYKNYTGDEKTPLNLKHCDIEQRQDLSLNETIRKLANRLDDSCDSGKNVCGRINVSDVKSKPN